MEVFEAGGGANASQARQELVAHDSTPPPDVPVPPRGEPAITICKRLRHPVDAVRAPRTAAGDTEQAHPTAGPETMPGDRLMRIFRAGRHVPAAVADEARQRELVEPHQRRAEHPTRRPAPGAGPVTPRAAVFHTMRMVGHFVTSRCLLELRRQTVHFMAV